MIGKAKSVKGSVAGMEYLQEEGKGYELDRNLLLGDSPKEIMREFRMQQIHNTICKRNMITAVLSPHIDDGKKLTDKDFVEMGKRFMEKLSIDTKKQAYIMILHDEKAHKHIHIYANRIQENGKAINDTFIGKKAQAAAHEVAKERGLISAKEIMFERLDLEKHKLKLIKKEIYKAHENSHTLNKDSLGKYILSMGKKGYEIYPSLNSKNEMQGLKVYDKINEIDFKMSEINRSMSLNNLLKSGMKNDLQIELKPSIKTLSKSKTSNVRLELNKNLKSTMSMKGTDVDKGITSINKTILKPIPIKMTKEEFTKWLKEREDFNRVMDDISFKNMQEQISEDRLREDLRKEIELGEIKEDKIDNDKEKEIKEEQEEKNKGRELDL